MDRGERCTPGLARGAGGSVNMSGMQNTRERMARGDGRYLSKRLDYKKSG